jgi:NTE family protein
MVRDFDALPRRFRAVAVDLAGEERVALGDGSLATAMRASMAIPGVFSPVRLEDMVLVDGGVLSRLPVEVARELGADIVIAVDLLQPQSPPADLETPTGVVGESLRLALDYYAEPARQDSDILIVPDLDGFTGNDYDRYDELIDRGVTAAEARRGELEELARQLRSHSPETAAPPSLERQILIRGVEARGGDERLQQEVIRRLGIRPGDRLDLLEVHRRVSALFPVGEIDDIRYTIENPRGSAPASEGTLVLDISQDFPRPHLLRFGYRISSRFTRGEQDTALLLANLTFRDLTGPGSSWSTDLYVINAERLLSRYQQPLGRFFFLAPQLEGRDEERPFYIEGNREAIFSDREVAAELQAGFELRAIARLYGGYRIGYVDSEVTTGTAEGLDSFEGRIGALVAGAETDTRDRFPFPTRGSREVVRYTLYSEAFGSELRSTALEASASQVIPLALDHSITAAGRFDTNFEDSPPAFLRPRLGGQESFVGYEQDAFIASNIAAASLGYQFRFAEGSGSLQEEFFLRLRGNVGSIYNGPLSQWRDDIDLIYGAAVGLGINSILGAFQLDVAWGGEERWIAYFSLGNAL